MNVLKKYGLLIYWFVLLLDCYFIFAQEYDSRWYTKLALVPILVIFVILHERKHHHFALRITYFSAMAAAWASDLLLLYGKKDVYFRGAIIATMVMYLFMSLFFFRLKSFTIKKIDEAGIAALMFVGVNYFLFQFMSDAVKGQAIPLLIGYVIMAGINLSLAANVLNSSVRKRLALNHFLPAAVLFFFSDAFLLVNKLKFQENFLDVVSMLSYGYAQYTLAVASRKVLKS